jgi:ribonuclease VapC
MIAVDTSALMAVLLREPESERCMSALETNDPLLISAATVAEALVVAGRRGVGSEMADLIERLGFDVIAVSERDAHHVAEAYSKWGKGLNPAGLNLGDCFAYALAKARGASLLYVGEDFARTDIEAAP